MKSVYERLVDEHGFNNAQKIILSKISPQMRVLELGSSAGYMTFEIASLKALVDVVEIDQESLGKAKRWANKAFSGSIEDKAVQDKIENKYDLIVCADVLEHLVDPESVLKYLKTKLKDQGHILISIPNVAFWDMRKQLFFKGDFKYQESGLLDKTHLRFYSLNNFLEILKVNFKINEVIPAETRFPFEFSIKKIPLIGKIFIKFFKKNITAKWPNLTYFHYVVDLSLKK